MKSFPFHDLNTKICLKFWLELNFYTVLETLNTKRQFCLSPQKKTFHVLFFAPSILSALHPVQTSFCSLSLLPVLIQQILLYNWCFIFCKTDVNSSKYFCKLFQLSPKYLAYFCLILWTFFWIYWALRWLSSPAVLKENFIRTFIQDFLGFLPLYFSIHTHYNRRITFVGPRTFCFSLGFWL